MTEIHRAWLTPDAHQRLKDELTTLIAQRAGQASSPRRGAAGEERWDRVEALSLEELGARDQRIRRLQETLQSSIVGNEPPDDGVAEPGMVITIEYADCPGTETVLLADREQGAVGDIEICSPRSPLGRSLLGAKQGERRQYLLPDGQVMAVSLVRAVPYRRNHQQTNHPSSVN
ncbi:GreA/GreB family elongation factor [Pseudonocardia sp. Cha107L01]|uniref:GreA/GreB family elongation factor n=1 Tax=Pseudonocardia sp. Cha107L01 TaxID=3457576 RepID=UPI00403E51DD